MNYQTHTLSNGLRLIHKYCDLPVAHCGIIINAGSRDELPGQKGVAHFLEHLVFKGTSKRKAYHVLSCMENVGGELNAYTSKEDTCIFASFLNQYYPRTLELLSDITFNSVFPKNEIIKEKEVVLDEFNSYKDNPSEEIFDEFEEALYGKHTLGNYILGKPDEIKKITRKTLIEFVKENYSPRRMVVASVGNIEFSKLVKLVENYFGSIPENSCKISRRKFRTYKPFTKIVTKNNFQAHCVIGTIAYDVRDERRTALTLLNNILGGPGMNSRLGLAIREKYGFCYNLESSYNPFTDSGIFLVYLGTDNEHLEKSIHLAYKELAKLKTERLGILQLKRAKLQLQGQIAIAQESNLNEMLSIGKSYLLFNKVDLIEDIYKKIDSVTAEELIEIARDIFATEKMSTLIYKAENNGKS
jgi:predicted Zn-dependent peptidase